MVTYSTLLIIVLVVQASTGLNPPSPRTRQLYSRAAHAVASGLVVVTLLTTPLPAEAALTKGDVKEIVKESEERQAKRFILYPVVSAVISGVISAGINVVAYNVASKNLDDALARNSIALDNVIARFASEKETKK